MKSRTGWISTCAPTAGVPWSRAAWHATAARFPPAQKARQIAAYASKLRAARVSGSYTCWPGMIHGFTQMAGLLDEARRAIDEIATFLRTRRVIGPKGPRPS